MRKIEDILVNTRIIVSSCLLNQVTIYEDKIVSVMVCMS